MKMDDNLEHLLKNIIVDFEISFNNYFLSLNSKEITFDLHFCDTNKYIKSSTHLMFSLRKFFIHENS